LVVADVRNDLAHPDGNPYLDGGGHAAGRLGPELPHGRSVRLVPHRRRRALRAGRLPSRGTRARPGRDRDGS